MRLFLLILALLCITPMWVNAQSPAEKLILDTELLRFKTMVDGDTSRLRSMLSDDLIYLHSNGLQETKAQHLAAIGSGRINYQTMVREPGVLVRRYGKMAIVNGKVKVKVLLDGNPITVTLLYSAVYGRQKKSWLLLNWQSTRAQSE